MKRNSDHWTYYFLQYMKYKKYFAILWIVGFYITSRHYQNHIYLASGSVNIILILSWCDINPYNSQMAQYYIILHFHSKWGSLIGQLQVDRNHINLLDMQEVDREASLWKSKYINLHKCGKSTHFVFLNTIRFFFFIFAVLIVNKQR